jgi:hypothetical protein
MKSAKPTQKDSNVYRLLITCHMLSNHDACCTLELQDISLLRVVNVSKATRSEWFNLTDS